jgi:medium-chain acyl-[acyl-carrier-protein] hydrolase
VTAQLLEAVRTTTTQSVAIFGHSLGALFGFELARELGGLCRHLFVSGMSAPHVRSRETRASSGRLSAASDEQILAEVARWNGGLPPELIEPELLEILLPRIRGDLALAESYDYRPGPPVEAPVTVLGGTSDRHSSRAAVDAWCEVAQNVAAMHWFEGDHMFLRQHEAAVCKVVREAITAASRA